MIEADSPFVASSVTMVRYGLLLSIPTKVFPKLIVRFPEIL